MEHLLSRFIPRSLRNLLPRQSSPSVSAMEMRLVGLLGVWPSEFSTIRLGRKYHYRPFSVTKRDGRERRILAPSPPLKKLQRMLLHRYLDTLPVHPAAMAFRRGCSIVDNAQRHAGQKLVATLDLVDFFESTTADRVRGFFLKQGWHGEALSMLMRLCVYRNGLPQGAPTSPALSNLVNYEMDERIADLARRADAVYTRYGDDLTFSWRTEHIPAYFVPALVSILTDAGYAIQPRKPWRVRPMSDEPKVTGLVLGRNGRIRAPLNLQWEVVKLRWHLFWHSGDAHARARLQGYQAFLQALEVKYDNHNHINWPDNLPGLRWEIFKLRWRLLLRPGDSDARSRLAGYQSLLYYYQANRKNSASTYRYISEGNDDYNDYDDEDDYDDFEDYDNDDLDELPF
ncbi:MAG: RNA-directed DNA polymerase [Anaerolineae bacterium]|nr:RNA-directed DNA polymerase [Anaerolineae bacterium]